VGSLVLGDVLAVYVGRQHLLVRASVGGHVNRIVDAHAVDIAATVLGLQHRPPESHACRIDNGVVDRVHPGRGGAQFLRYLDLVAGLGHTFQAVLVQLARAKLPLHARIVDRAVFGHERRPVELDRANPVHRPNDGAPAPQVEQARRGDRRHAVRGNAGLLLLFGAALVSDDLAPLRLRHARPALHFCAHSFLQKQKTCRSRSGNSAGYSWSCGYTPPDSIAPPISRSPYRTG